MSENFLRKHGLLYSLDMKTVIGVDDSSNEVTGKIPYGAKSIDDDVFSECPYEEFQENGTPLRISHHFFVFLLIKRPLGLLGGC